MESPGWEDEPADPRDEPTNPVSEPVNPRDEPTRAQVEMEERPATGWTSA